MFENIHKNELFIAFIFVLALSMILYKLLLNHQIHLIKTYLPEAEEKLSKGIIVIEK